MKPRALSHALHDPLFEFPAGHLPRFEPARQFITRDAGRAANHPGNFKGICNRDAATVKNGMGRCRFIMLTSGAPPRKGRFSDAIISMAATPANITIAPLLVSNHLQTLLSR